QLLLRFREAFLRLLTTAPLTLRNGLIRLGPLPEFLHLDFEALNQFRGFEHEPIPVQEAEWTLFDMKVEAEASGTHASTFRSDGNVAPSIVRKPEPEQLMPSPIEDEVLGDSQ